MYVGTELCLAKLIHLDDVSGICAADCGELSHRARFYFKASIEVKLFQYRPVVHRLETKFCFTSVRRKCFLKQAEVKYRECKLINASMS
jgi:hypothetical protein